ncbi:MAG: VCBS repeat-containing protein [Armatimonadetes bacterium]|nr:VCBS repeat-containing protein [Armatimonadota bacterium]
MRWICLLLAVAPSFGALTFQKTVIDPTFRGEGVATADVNHDGKLDVLAGDLWYEAPTWKQHPIRPLGNYDWKGGYSKVFYVFAADINKDGWTDEIIVDTPNAAATWYENPKGAEGNWKERRIAEHVCNETPWFGDLLGDGVPAMVFADEKPHEMRWYRPAADLDQPWDSYVVGGPGSLGTNMYSHGLGVGDLNGDKRLDVMVKEGWWEAPADRTKGAWDFHRARLGQDCAQMVACDVNGDGRADVITSSAHRYGVWWYEQQADGSFVEHVIDDKISQTHALHVVDLDGDGLPEVVTGKRFWVHMGADPGSLEPAYLSCYKLARDGGTVTWSRLDLENDSGVGQDFTVVDLDGDGKLDIVVSNKKGVAIHLRRG